MELLRLFTLVMQAILGFLLLAVLYLLIKHTIVGIDDVRIVKKYPILQMKYLIVTFLSLVAIIWVNTKLFLYSLELPY